MVKKSLSGDLHKNGKRGRHGIKSDTVLVRTELKNGVSPKKIKPKERSKKLYTFAAWQIQINK